MPLRRAGRGRYVGRGVRISEGPSRLSFDPKDIVDWIPTHQQIFGAPVGATRAHYSSPAASPERGRPPDVAALAALLAAHLVSGQPTGRADRFAAPVPVGPGHPFGSYGTMWGQRFYKRPEQVPVAPGLAIRFAQGYGYYSVPTGQMPPPPGGFDTSPAPAGGWRM